MARTSNALLKGVKGAIGKQIVVKQYGNKTVISAMPDMSNVKRSELQKKANALFSEAVKYAQAINRNPATKKAYAKKITTGATVFNYAMAEYMKRNG